MLAAYQDDTDKAIDLWTKSPEPVAPPTPKRSWWAEVPDAIGRSLGTAIPAAAAEAAAGVGEIVTGTARALDSMRRAPNKAALDAARAKPADGRNPFSQAMRDVAESFRPDPTTAGTAEQIVYGATKGIGKAVAYVGTLGPAGAAAFAVDEGLTALDDLQRKGVDTGTAQQAAVVQGLTAGTTVLLPAGGATLKGTAALVAVGGPGSFMAQQALTADILERADYGKIAASYDPLDPVGITVTTALALTFGGAAAARIARAPKAGKPAAPEEIDAAMTHNVTAQQDGRPTSNPVPSLEDLFADNLGRERASMPQIPKAHKPAFLDELAAAGVKVTEETVPANSLRATQRDYKADNIAFLRGEESAGRWGQDGGGSRILVARDGRVLDGHHRWAYRAQDGAPIEVLRVDLDMPELLARAGDFNTRTGIAARTADDGGKGLEAIYMAAEREKVGFDAAIQELADLSGGRPVTVPLKTREKSAAKVAKDYGGDASKLKDVLRATIEVDSSDAARRAVAGIFERFEVLPTGRRNLLTDDVNPTDGYRDAKFNVVVGGHVAEIQVNVPEMLAAKEGGGHKLYDEREALIKSAAGRVFTEAEQARYDDLNAQMRAIYEPAWEAATRRLNSASEISDPLRLTESGGNERGAAPSHATVSDGPTPALKDTGTPSTSQNSARGENSSGKSSALMRESIKRLEESDPAVAERLAAVRKEAAEGTATELGALDADLIRVAAECALTLA